MTRAWPGSTWSRSWPSRAGGFVTSAGARTLLDAFRTAAGRRRARAFEDDLRALGDDRSPRADAAGSRRGWTSFATRHDLGAATLAEAVAAELCSAAA